ncbi:hypothetical protein SEA_CAMBIARE_42 [Mycobacterium phage Cambiare]|uniref:Uncharacterized protein n=1 Tax=Mycobacterium phage Cambiare TaxID=1647305 RepID=A0A0F6WEC6_9CAUD|nr:hypothetical protein AVT48_gp42 [Mycobacterium phage Cambiare]AKF14544.1 hypothetical protein SEA_CAMBIARE_42 [Mycobacterium phage Cambiare]
MKIDLSDVAQERITDLIRAIDANTAALERANEQRDFEQNGPRG